jgi:hypothetical protein
MFRRGMTVNAEGLGNTGARARLQGTLGFFLPLLHIASANSRQGRGFAIPYEGVRRDAAPQGLADIDEALHPLVAIQDDLRAQVDTSDCDFTGILLRASHFNLIGHSSINLTSTQAFMVRDLSNQIVQD